MEGLTTGIDSQFKEIRGDMKEMRDGCNKYGGPHPSSDCDNKPLGGSKDEEVNYASEGYRGGYRGNYYGRNSSNWRDRHENQSSTPKKTANDFVKNQFNNLKTKVEQGQKNHQATIQDLETKFGRISNHQSSRPPDFVILQMEEDDRVPLILGRPFLHTVDAIIRVKNKELNLENVQEDEVKDDFEELPPEDELRIKKSIQDRPTDLEMKPLLKHLEYAFLDKNSLLPVVILALLKQDEKERLDSILKNHKEAFAWKTFDILGISLSFCKHKINFEDNVKPVIQRQRRLNPNMKEVIIKEIIKLLDVCIIYAIEDNHGYENSKLYKAQTKAYHDKKLRVRKEVKAGDKVLLYNSKYKFKAPKLRPKWCGPFIVKHGYPFGYVELYDKHGGSFIVNGHRVKLYHDEEQLNELTIEDIYLMCEEGRMKAIPFMAPFPADYRETMP
nr:reverse transcriptase domain-containing protein [Tanacetum cinerariifolium]